MKYGAGWSNVTSLNIQTTQGYMQSRIFAGIITNRYSKACQKTSGKTKILEGHYNARDRHKTTICCDV